VGEVLPLEEHPHAELFRQSRALGDGGRPPRVRLQQRRVLTAERVVVPRGAEFGLELVERADERLRHEAAAEVAEAAEAGRFGARRELDGTTTFGRRGGHDSSDQS
jgi:hypothetical protein